MKRGRHLFCCRPPPGCAVKKRSFFSRVRLRLPGKARCDSDGRILLKWCEWGQKDA
ncbi:hypothetical protein HMPREF0262_01986 [Clostridium sp. ATCC 29733]|nr:hypothetical protein HMPREF0262_01986 [Clostridium sp. ATCC 29733]